MKRPKAYRKKTVIELLEAYEFERDRINQEDKKTTQDFIVNELCERVKSAFRQLDEGCSVYSVYKQLMEG